MFASGLSSAAISHRIDYAPRSWMEHKVLSERRSARRLLCAARGNKMKCIKGLSRNSNFQSHRCPLVRIEGGNGGF